MGMEIKMDKGRKCPYQNRLICYVELDCNVCPMNSHSEDKEVKK